MMEFLHLFRVNIEQSAYAVQGFSTNVQLYTPRVGITQRNARGYTQGYIRLLKAFSIIMCFTSHSKSWPFLFWAGMSQNRIFGPPILGAGLQYMKDSNSPHESLRLFQRAIDVYPGYSDAYFWKAKALFILSEVCPKCSGN